MGDQQIKNMILEFLEKQQGNCNPSNPLWKKVTEGQSKKRCLESWKQRVHCVTMTKKGVLKSRRWRRSRNSAMKRIHLDGSRRSTTGFKNKVRTLKKLIPNGESMQGLDGVFRETADYILALQMRVKLMQIMVKVLSGDNQ